MTESRQPAPGDLAVVQRFVNSADFEAGDDALADPDTARTRLTAIGLPVGDVPLDAGDLRRLIEVREAIRALALANNDEPLDPGAPLALSTAAIGAALRVTVTAEGTTVLAPAASDGVDAVVGAVLAAVHDARCEGTWDRLKACREETCRWAFYDRSRNRSSSWCVMSVCGNRAKARAYRERKRGE